MIAFVREVSPSLGDCELTYLARGSIDWRRAERQHREYVEVLKALGCRVERLPPLRDHPDGVFVEDTALVLPEVAVIMRPGAASRRGETDSVAQLLSGHLPSLRIVAPGTLEGGDILRIGRTLYVGASARTNAPGIAQLWELLHPFGYQVRTVPFEGCLHLKSACTFIPPDILVINPNWVDPSVLEDAPVIVPVDEGEPFAANTLTVGGVTLASSAYPKTQARLNARGVATRALDVSELHKAEAALTCLSLLLEPPLALIPGP